MARPPGGVIALGAVLVLTGLFFPVAGLLTGTLYGQIHFLDPTWGLWTAALLDGAAAVVFLLAGGVMFLIYAGIGVAVWTRQPWAWVAAIVLTVLLLPILLWPPAIVLALLLARQDVRDAFKIEGAAPPPAPATPEPVAG